MYFDSQQLFASTLLVFVTSAVAIAIIFQRGRERAKLRAWGYAVIAVCALTALAAWTRFGALHYTAVDADPARVAGPRPKKEVHQPLHFHEFFHYYLGAKYFRELGYLGLYDCTAAADAEIAGEEGVGPRVTSGWVRDLDDVLRDRPRGDAIAACQDGRRARFTDARWGAFKRDLRELHRLVPDDWWNDVVYDAGFNPPPSWVLLGGAIANAIPIRAAGAPTYLIATSLDVALLIVCYFALRRAFGALTAATAVVFFGASFISTYAWNGGAFLRFTWMTSVVLGLAAMKRGRWALAGALLGAAACDRIFPGAFAAGAAIALAARAIGSDGGRGADRAPLMRFAGGVAAAVATLGLLSVLAFGLEPWRVFFSRILRHGDVYFVMHIGLKKVLTWRAWVPSQNFMGHDGLVNFRAWNLRLRDTWAEMRPLALPLQVVVAGATAAACVGRRPYEAAMLFGAMSMFVFNIPANYYFAVYALIPALVMRAAITAPSAARRLREYVVFAAFAAWWLGTLVASRFSGDALVYSHLICATLAGFMAVWIGAWVSAPANVRRLASMRSALRALVRRTPRAPTA